MYVLLMLLWIILSVCLYVSRVSQVYAVYVLLMLLWIIIVMV